MDPLPLIPENNANHEAAPVLRASLQETLDGYVYSKEIAEQFVNNAREKDDTFRSNAKQVLEIHERAQEKTDKTQMAAVDIMYQNALYFIQKDKIDRSSELRERIKLGRCTLFKRLEEGFVTKFNLLKESDLLPSMIQRYLDFRNHDHTICPACKEKIIKKDIKQKTNIEIKRNLQSDTMTLIKKLSFQIVPDSVIFHNYEIDEVYKKNVKIINSSATMQSIGIRSLPNSQYFSAMINDNHKLAPGMSLTVTFTFKPKVFQNLRDSLVVNNNEGEMAEIPLSCTRDLPQLISCIFKSNSYCLGQCEPDSIKFAEERREALNSTIDCGSCLVSQYVLVSIILENTGKEGKFFIITEDEWYFLNVETVSACMELFKGDFWIYPNYFEIRNEEIVEINIIFQPTKPGLIVETLYVICDNNAFEQIELMGDAFEFSKSYIEIEIPSNESLINKDENYCISFGSVKNGTSHSVMFSVRNKSYLALTCEWNFTNVSSKDVLDIKENWILQKKMHTKLVSCGKIDYEFSITFDAQKTGYHNIFFNFYITNIPLISLEENEEFICIEREDISEKTLSKAVDVLIKKIEVCAMVDVPPPKTGIECLCDTVIKPPQPKMGFSCPVINFGIVPTGINVKKDFFIRNDTNHDLNWSILEVKYNLDSFPHMEVIKKSENLSESSGMCDKRRNRKLFYQIVDKKPISWVSILVLISVNINMESAIEDVCIVTYEIINFDIVIKAKDSKNAMPALMPMHLMYRGIPTELKFGIENRSLIPGYFQFLLPFGEDRDRLIIELTPSSCIIKAFETITIKAKLICWDIGFIHNFFIPCFIGVGQEPVVLRVLCAVDGPHVLFSLPVQKNHVKRVIWPPKIVYEYDTDPWCSCRNKECLAYEDEGEGNFNFQNFMDGPPLEELLQKNTDATFTVSDSHTEKSSPKSLETFESGETSNSRTRRLEGVISKEFDTDKNLHDDIVEVHEVPIFTPTKVTVFIENVTPIYTKFTFESQRFVENKKFDHVAVRLHLKKRDELWNDLMGTEYGILVQPEIASGELNINESAKIDIWIYANTYGIYSEEIFVDLLEMPSYHFTMLIEVVGNPLVLPMAVNCITKYPTIRFSTVPFHAAPVTRQLKIINRSSIPVHIYWHAFLKSPNEPDVDKGDAFNIFFHMTKEEKLELVYSMDEYCGRNVCDFCYVEPNETDIKEHSSTFVQIVLKPGYFDVDTKTIDAVSCLVGHLFLKPEYRKKTNYFVRKTGPDINSLKIEATITIERPNLEIELNDSPFLVVRMYANEVLLKKNFETMKYTVLRNSGEASYLLDINIEEPFYFKSTKKGRLESNFTVNIAPKSNIELNICCSINFENMLVLSELVYDNCFVSDKYPFCKNKVRGQVCQVDVSEKVIQMSKRMTVVCKEGTIEFPMVAFLYFPRISVSPCMVQFGNILLNTTQKSMFTIFNYTGYEVKFEIYKSSGASNFLIVPHYGEVPRLRGCLKAFTNIFIYFRPTECRKYRESLRVVTNIPNYWVEIGLRGLGSLNATFALNYKI